MLVVAAGAVMVQEKVLMLSMVAEAEAEAPGMVVHRFMAQAVVEAQETMLAMETEVGSGVRIPQAVVELVDYHNLHQRQEGMEHLEISDAVMEAAVGEALPVALVRAAQAVMEVRQVVVVAEVE